MTYLIYRSCTSQTELLSKVGLRKRLGHTTTLNVSAESTLKMHYVWSGMTRSENTISPNCGCKQIISKLIIVAATGELFIILTQGYHLQKYGFQCCLQIYRSDFRALKLLFLQVNHFTYFDIYLFFLFSGK